MKKLSSGQKKFLKVIHLVFAGIWITGVFTLGAMSLLSDRITKGDELYMFNYLYHFIDMYFVSVGASITFLTGLIYSVFTPWGFFKHGWLVYKWIVTVFIIVIGTFYLGPMVSKMLQIADVDRISALQNSYYLHGERIGLIAAIINSVLLLVAIVVSVYKPWKNWKVKKK